MLVWLGLLLASFAAIVRTIYANADVVSAPVIGELFSREAAGATTTLGFLPWYTTLWFELATRWLPFHRAVWEVAPWIGSVAGIVLVAWATARAAGRWAGWFVAFVLVCAGDRLLPVQFAADLHGATAIDVCVLDAFLVLLVSRGGRIGGRATNLLLCAAVAAFAAGGVASDSLLIPAGLLPFVLAGASQYWFSPGAAGRRIAATVLAVTVAAAVGAGIAVAAMHAEGVYAARNTIRFATWDSLLTNLTHLAQSTADLFNGDFGGAAIGARSGLAFACAVAFGWAVVLAFREGRRQLGRLRQPGADSVREAHVAFWAAAAALSAAAFVFSSFAEVSGGRYLVAAGYGVVVLAAVAASRAGSVVRAAGVLAACVVVAGSVVALGAGDIKANPGHYPGRDFAHFLSTFAQGENLKYGYASYWDAAALTWESKAAVEVYPALPCSAPPGLCTYPLHEISSWYRPKPNARTFLVTDPRYGPSDPGQRLGGPLEVVSYREYKIYVYGYDIASDFGDWRAYGADAS
jgi:hypothetical protein